MSIRAILLDFDGTALMPNQVFLSFRNMRALREAVKRGVEIIPCTGRNADTMPLQIQAMPEIRYWVTSNGGRVIDHLTGEVIYSSTFTPEESAMICHMFEEQGIYAEIAAEGHIYIEKEANDQLHRYPIPWHHIWYLDPGVQIPVDKPSQYFREHNIGIEKINFYGLTPTQHAAIAAQLEQTGVVTSYGSPNSFQIFPKRQDRKEAVSVLLQRLGYGYESVMSLGDSPMDEHMLQGSAYGVAMGNAPEKVKACAKYVTAPYDEDGVAQAIEELILGEYDFP